MKSKNCTGNTTLKCLAVEYEEKKHTPLNRK